MLVFQFGSKDDVEISWQPTERETRVDLGTKAVGEKERSDIAHRNKGQESLWSVSQRYLLATHFISPSSISGLSTRHSNDSWRFRRKRGVVHETTSHCQSLTKMTVGFDKRS